MPERTQRAVATVDFWPVQQSHMCFPLPAIDVRLFGTCLVAATPAGPVHDLRGGRRWLPDQREDWLARHGSPRIGVLSVTI